MNRTVRHPGVTIDFDQFYLARAISPRIALIPVIGAITVLVAIAGYGHGADLGRLEALPLVLAPLLALTWFLARTVA